MDDPAQPILAMMSWLGFKKPAGPASAVPDDASLDALAEILQVLSSPSRLALLAQLQQPRSVADLTVPPSRSDEGLSPERGLSRQSTERHLDILADAGLVSWREGEGRARGAKQYVLNHARLFAAVEELRTLTRLRAVAAQPEATMDLREGSREAPLPDPESVKGPRLVLVRGVPEGRILSLPMGDAILGRGPECALRLDHDPFVSTRHCRLRASSGVAAIEDTQDARNGTLLNGRRLKPGEMVTLKRGNLVGVGRSLLLYLD